MWEGEKKAFNDSFITFYSTCSDSKGSTFFNMSCCPHGKIWDLNCELEAAGRWKLESVVKFPAFGSILEEECELP